MEHLHGGLTLELCPGAFPLSTDSMVLADFVKLPKNAQVIDLGSGCGTLGLLLCGKDPGCRVTGIELDPAAHEMALHNSRTNRLESRLGSICGDVTALSSLVEAGSYTCAVSNPPYFTGGPDSKTVPLARKEDACPLEALFSAAAWALRYGGDFFLVQKPEKLARICACAAAVKLEPKRLRLVRHHPGSDINMILLQCRKGGKPGLIWEELCLFDLNGDPTPDYRRIYHL